MIKWIKTKISSAHEKFHSWRKWKNADQMWSLYGGSCFGLFPPSFYHKHSEEEIQRLKQEEIEKLKEKLQEFQMRNEGKV